MDVNGLVDKLKEYFAVSAYPHDNNELFTIIGKILPEDYKYGKVRRELSTFQKRLQFYFSLFKAQKYRPGMTTHEAFRRDMTILEDEQFPPTLRELYAVSELLEQRIILLKITDDCETVSGFYISPILRETSKTEKIMLLLTFVDGEPYFQHLEGEEGKLTMCPVTLLNENHDMCLDKRFKNSFQELNASFILKQVERLNISNLEEAMATITISETEKTNIFVVLSQLVYGSECMEEFVKDHVIAHMKSDEFYEIYQAFVCLDKFEEEKKAIDRLPEGKAKETNLSDLRKKAFHFHLEQWDTVSIVDFFAVASVFNVQIYVKKGKCNLFLPTCSSFSKIFSSPIYLEQASNSALIPLLDSNNCSCVCRKPLIPGRLPVYQEMIEDFIMKRLALEPCCPVGKHGTHKHFSTIKDFQIVPNDQISSYQSPLDRHVEKVIEVLDTQGRKLDQINGGKGSLEQCLSREIFGDEEKISFFKSRFCGGKPMNPEEILSVVANSTEKPLFVFKYYPESYSWVLIAPNSATTKENLCRYYITIFYNGLTGYFDRIVAKNGCNCILPSPAVDVRTNIDLKQDEKKILAANRHNPLLTFLSTDISETSFIDEVRHVPTVFSRYSEIPLITSRYDMQDKEIDFMSDYSYSLCRCVSKEIFGTENEFELIMKEVVNEIHNNPHLYGKFMRWDKDETENEEFLKNFTSRKRKKMDFFKRQKSVEKEQALFYANRIEDGMEMEDLELLAIATCFQVPVFVICVEEDKGIISTSWKEFTQIKRKHRPRQIRNIARKSCCNIDSDGFSKFFIMVYRTFSGQFHRIVSKEEICNCLTEQPKVPEIEYHKVSRADENIFAKMRSIENRLTVTRLALDNWLRCNMALEILCTRIIDGLE
ncbi:uncharacterized protein LOC133178591 isoform X2 [Saccostrea echinata]|uniref:uncharacterized protein LOC133178591 isoform X2 n=1 Tax=Saccostrea echinata TaxID=191078 RepID=UPI002A7F2AF5|nr:uncharacterized protein LOC133178591 isoform X2 [Saccostrea echinata]